tara:strand:- start:1900 stop:2169 length:270 start_codon:yes stop_codon:yes gene_type:complete
LDFRKTIVSDFAIVFDQEQSEEQQERIIEQGFGEKWGWFGIMHRLTNQDISKLENITKLNLLECLTWLSYETELNQQNKLKYDSNKQIV